MKCDELKALESATAVIGNVHLVYTKDEVDAAIAELKADNRKLKRALWMAMENVYHLQMMLTCSNSESILFKRACRRHQKYLELADKFK